VSFDAISSLDPRIVRKAVSKAWKKGGSVHVGLKSSDSETGWCRKSLKCEKAFLSH